jgi:hypothetical protein
LFASRLRGGFSFFSGPMKTYKLQIREHFETGDPGIVFVGGLNGRDYFEPGLSGEQIAHDILEHPASPHPNGIIDELLALGGFLAGRIQHGYMNRGRRELSMDDLWSDLAYMARTCLTNSEPFCAKPCNSFLRDSAMMAEIKVAVMGGLKEAWEEYFDQSRSYADNYKKEIEDLFDVQSTVSWICKGVQLFRKRFARVSIFDVSDHLFPVIAKECDRWLMDDVEIGDEAKLIVDISGLRAELIVDRDMY